MTSIDTTHAAAIEPALDPAGADIRDYWELLKPRVMTLVVFTGLAGILVAPGALHPILALVTVLCIALGAGAAGCLNMWHERDLDAAMTRTRSRPLVQGRVSPEDALVFGIALTLLPIGFLGVAVNWLAAGILALASVFYVGVYTLWLKRRSAWNIVIGGAAGAFPPVIGWAAVTGEVGATAWALFAVIFMWTPPHFWALAIDRAEDYRKAGVPMLPVVKGARATTRQILLYTASLIPLGALPYIFGDAGLIYLIGGLALGLVFAAAAWRLHREPSRANGLRVFGFSILYLFMLFALVIVDATHGPLRVLFG